MELSLHILDVAENAVLSGASLIEIELDETPDAVAVTVTDDGCGMTEEELGLSIVEGYTTKEHGLGLGLPKFRSAAVNCGGTFSIKSVPARGTTVRATFPKNEELPLGDMTGAVCALLSGIGEGNVVFTHDITDEDGTYRVGLDTRAERRVLGDVPISTPEVIIFMREYLGGQYNNKNTIFGGENL